MAKKKSRKRPSKPGPKPHATPRWEWTEALAVQQLCRELEIVGTSQYLTNPNNFKTIATVLGGALRTIDGLALGVDDAAKETDCDCPAGYNCCCGKCQPYGRQCELGCLDKDKDKDKKGKK
jgi:hypothetical protein